MRKFSVFFILIGLHCSPISSGFRGRLYIWDVGQGQWVTWAEESRCTHFDMGGEKAPLKHIQFLCGRKQNAVLITHADTDHIKFLGWGFRHLTNLCLASTPQEKLKPQKQWILKAKMCNSTHNSRTREIEFDTTNLKESNELSRVFLIKTQSRNILIPGDSVRRSEKRWLKQLTPFELLHPTSLVLGHHGSKTSTHHELLASFQNLNHGFCSARKRRYGHPHATVTKRVRRFGTPLICTEPWGHIRMDL
jgi:competence protein ComEC